MQAWRSEPNAGLEGTGSVGAEAEGGPDLGVMYCGNNVRRSHVKRNELEGYGKRSDGGCKFC